MPLSEPALHRLLDEKGSFYHRREFIDGDPLRIPHRFSKRQDIEIAGLFAAVLAWGSRTTIINSCSRLLGWMDDAPYDFVLNHRDTDLKRFLPFAHRTFNATDALYFIDRLRMHYRASDSLEDLFEPEERYAPPTVREALIGFHDRFFAPEHPERTCKHIATPARNSACKRLNMYLRWMVRRDELGIDFGLWRKFRPAQLVCPLDVHVASTAFRLGILPDEKAHWRNAELLTATLRRFRPDDPAWYDFALFGMGAEERM